MIVSELIFITIIKDLLDFEQSKVYKTCQRLFEKFQTKIEIDELIPRLSASIDKMIINYAKENQLNPLGGNINIYFCDDNLVYIEWHFYFTAKNAKSGNKITKISSKKSIDKQIFTDSSLQRISENLNYAIKKPMD